MGERSRRNVFEFLNRRVCGRGSGGGERGGGRA